MESTIPTKQAAVEPSGLDLQCWENWDDVSYLNRLDDIDNKLSGILNV